MNEINVSALWYTLIKGTKGIWKAKAGESVQVDERGIKNDRRWVVVENNMFVAQRRGTLSVPLPSVVQNALTPLGLGIEVRSMCQIMPYIDGDELVVRAPGMRDLHLPAAGVPGQEEGVVVWRDRELPALDQGKEASAWFTQFLSRERPGTYRLMRMADRCRRKSKDGVALMGFHDGYPFTMISDESLGALNAKLFKKGEAVVNANRFRANIWLRGCVRPHEEDSFGTFYINGIEFKAAKLCDRCPVICTDQDTGKRGKEPRATLETYRTGRDVGIQDNGQKVYFGVNVAHRNTGTIHVWDEVRFLPTEEAA